MASDKQTTPRKERKPGVFSFLLSPIAWSISIISYIIFSIILGTIIEWVGMNFFWEKNHAYIVLQQEFAYLGDNFTTTLFGVSAHDAGLIVVNYLRDWLIIPQNIQAGKTVFIMQKINQLGVWTTDYINSFVFVSMVILIRCLIVLLSSALFIIIGIAAAVDGLHLRELRKVSGGVEHAGIYHRAKRLVPLSIKVAPVLYLAWPNSINPNFILLPGMMVFFIAVLTSFATFKKYV